MPPEEEAKLDARFKEALGDMRESNIALEWELAELKGNQ